ncbi:MAG: 4Fe-4S binding protein [Eubacteriaceae bacterium]|nr:4Fe-4S binding protein [Eubacteriaceae bacterium]
MDKKKRLFIQLLSCLLHNANLPGFFTGRIYQGPAKGICAPGLNCYSCPGAVCSCPIGALQASIGQSGRKLPLYIAGTLVLFGALLGRGICAFLCPFGLFQELLYKIPSKKFKKSSLSRKASLLKYLVLGIFVVYLPLFYLAKNGVGSPAFCKFICPAGTLEGGLPLMAANSRLRVIAGALFGWKLFVLVFVAIASVFLYRAFCRFICPLGAIYSLFNHYALFGVEVNESECIGCNECVKACKLDTKAINDRECIRCAECAGVCPRGAVAVGGTGKEKKWRINRKES